MPSGRTLQLGSIHQYKDNFAKPYEISYESEDGSHKSCHQTTYGMSERILGALVGVHGDNKGLVMPPEVAPVQVVIIPIIFKDKEKKVLDECKTLSKQLQDQGIRLHVDDRDLIPDRTSGLRARSRRYGFLSYLRDHTRHGGSSRAYGLTRVQD